MSGRQAKRRRQEARAAAPRRARTASARVLIASAAAVVLVAASALVSVRFLGHSSSALDGTTSARVLLDGIQQRGNVLGAPDAPVTLVEYVDLQCPYCREFETTAMPDLIRRYVRAGKLRVELRPLAFIGADSVRGRNAIIAAGRQNHLFEFTQLLYDNQRVENTGWLSETLVGKAAAAIPGLDAGRLDAARSSAAVAAEASAYDVEAKAAGVSSTPTLLAGKTGSNLDPVDAASVSSGIAALVG